MTENEKPFQGVMAHEAIRGSEYEQRLADFSAGIARESLMREHERKEARERQLPSYYTSPINLELAPYDEYVQTPTPLDPTHVKIHESVSYGHHALLWMSKRLDATLRANRTELLEEHYDTILEEITDQHEHRMRQNTTAYGRMLDAIMKEPARAAGYREEKIVALRSGAANSADRLRLLAKFPEMGGIEDMKDTAALNLVGYMRSRKGYLHSLLELTWEKDIVVALRDNNGDDMHVERLDQRGMLFMSRNVIADAIVNDTPLEVVERRSFCALPTKPQLRGIPENIFRPRPDEAARNMQLIGGSVYFRTKRKVLDTSDPEEMGEILLVNGSSEEAFAPRRRP